jgi:DNA helicase-2/ATP-dependent DNA helicase PcrA
MPPICARTIGGPGAGKTYRLLEILDLCLQKIIADPLMVGFVSFTRAARREASTRAAARFGVRPIDLEKDGWFKTLHAIAYRALGIAGDELIVGTKEDTAWLQEALDDPHAKMNHSDNNDDLFILRSSSSQSGMALSLWDVARNRLCPLGDVHQEREGLDDHLPDLDYCERVVDDYEAAKARDGRLDFTDLLLRFSGRQFSGGHAAPFAQVEPRGEFPILPVVIGDEWQDCSILMALAFRRLTQFSKYAYIAGDHYQSIYSFCGASPDIFTGWPVQKEEALPASHRCPANVLALADSIMQPVHGPRDFAPVHPGGEIVRSDVEEALASVRPGEDTLVLARTNEMALAAARYLDDCAIPWKPTKGSGGFAAPARAAGVTALVDLQKGRPINGEGYHRLLDLLPSRTNGTVLFESGTKKKYDTPEHRDHVVAVPLHLLHLVGATPACQELIASGKYLPLLEKPAQRMVQAALEHGVDAIGKPTIRVGTAHSAKGQEAEHVVAINRLPYPTVRAMEEEGGMEEERRVWYTTLTRASKKLTIATGEGEAFPI